MRASRPDPLPWDAAWQAAHFGPEGFFTAGAGPAAHFRTAVHAAPGPLATAMARLARRHGCTAVLDVGAGRGELLAALAACPEADGLGLHGIDVVPRPADLPAAVHWSTSIDATPDTAFDHALIVAWELLDDVPCPVLEVDGDGVARTVLVDPATGVEELGEPAGPDDIAWCRRWWPLDGSEEGDRAEVGRPRDELWAGLVGRAAAHRPATDSAADSGAVLLAVDYAHSLGARPPGGSLAGFRAGRVVPPVPDGSCNVTAHVALDAVAAAGEAAGAVTVRLTDQRAALIDLGLAAPAVTPGGRATDLLDRLAARSQVAELLDRGSLGSFGWLLQHV